MTSQQDSRLQTITAEALGVDPAEITEESSPETLGAWTSFSHLTMMAAVEEEFGLIFSMEEMTAVRCYKDLHTLVGQNIKH